MYRWWWEWKRSWSASPFLVGDDAALYIRVLAIGDDATSAVDKRFEGKLDDKDHRGRYRFAHVSCQQYGGIKRDGVGPFAVGCEKQLVAKESDTVASYSD